MSGLQDSFMQMMMQNAGMINPNVMKSIGTGQSLTGGQSSGFDITGADSFKANFPQAGQLGAGGQNPGMFGGIGGLEGLSAIMSGIGSLGQAYAAVKGVGMAKKQYNFQKKAWETNLQNQTQSYNTQVEDRANSRANFSGDQNKATDYIKKHSL